MIKSKLTNKEIGASVKAEEIQLKSFSIRETRRDSADLTTYSLKSYRHWENMLLILIEKAVKDKNYQIVNLLTNKMVMKAVSQGLTGTATKDDVLAILSYFNDEPIFKAFVKHSKENLNGHNCSMIVERVKAQHTEIKERRELWESDRAAYHNKFKTKRNARKPEYQKPKKLNKTSHYSLPIEGVRWNVTKKGLSITYGKRRVKHYVNVDAEFLKDKEIKAINVSTSNGQVEYNLLYIAKSDQKIRAEKGIKDKRPRVEAGLDIGINNLFSLFINDEKSPSIIYDGKRVKHQNSKINRKIARLQKQKSKEAIKSKIVETKRKDKYIVPTEYSERGVKIQHIINNLYESRKRYFDDQFNKISLKILQHLNKCKVTDLVISRNLSFAKKDGSIEMRKGSKQNFYQIPFGKLLNLIEAKAGMFGIKIHNIDEAYTSKTSCLSGDVNLVQVKSRRGEKIKSMDLNGSRGGITRGLYKDLALNKLINSDLNGAANHIKVCFGDKVNLSTYWNKLWKLCNPIKIKSASEFDRLLSNNDAKRKITCDIGLNKINTDVQVCLV